MNGNSRRRFLIQAGAASMVLAGHSVTLDAQQSDAERPNIALVSDFCAAFATHDINRIGAFLAESAVWRGDNGSFATNMPAVGRQAILDRISRFLERIVEFKVLRSYAMGTVVITERVDRFMPERSLHLTGVFYMKDSKILEWTDFLA